MRWIYLGSIFPEMSCWGATRGRYQFVVSNDQLNNVIIASVKVYPNIGDMKKLGEFTSVEVAMKACENWGHF